MTDERSETAPLSLVGRRSLCLVFASHHLLNGRALQQSAYPSRIIGSLFCDIEPISLQPLVSNEGPVDKAQIRICNLVSHKVLFPFENRVQDPSDSLDLVQVSFRSRCNPLRVVIREPNMLAYRDGGLELKKSNRNSKWRCVN